MGARNRILHMHYYHCYMAFYPISGKDSHASRKKDNEVQSPETKSTNKLEINEISV